MDAQTKAGLGLTLMGIAASLATPYLPLSIAAPAIALCFFGAAFLLWPAARSGMEKLKFGGAGRIPLFEAATRAYEQTQGTEAAIFDYANSESSDDILIRMCDRLTRYRDGKAPLVKLYGSKPPSREIEEIYMAPLNRYEFVVVNGSIILNEQTGSFQYENLTVDKKELAGAIAKMLENQAL